MASSNLSSADDHDDMGSLFEGMVLFSPLNPPDSDQQPPQDISPAASASSTDASSGSLPLDENLFSDLTILDPPPDTKASLLPEDRPVQSSLERQTSNRKKKRAAGLRIGYGRDKDGAVSIVPEELDEPSQVEKTEHEENQLPPVGFYKAEDLESAGSSGDGREDPVQPVVVSSSSSNESTIESRLEESTIESRLEESTTESRLRLEESTIESRLEESTVESRLEDIRWGIKNRLEHAREAVVSASAARKDALKRRRKAAGNLSQAFTKHRELEKELEQACESEDFEKAERISDSIASAESEKDLLVDLLKEAEAEYDSIDSKMMEALERQIEVEEEASSLLQKFALDASKDADLAIQNAKEVSSKEIELCLSSTEQVELHKMELEIQSQLLQEARLALSDSIEHSVEDEQKEMDLLCKKRELLQEDLEKLLALVKQKEAEILENDFKIEVVEKRITGTKFSFEEVQSDLNAQLKNLQRALQQVESEQDILAKRNEETIHLLHQEEIRGSKIKETLRISTDEADVFKEAVALRKRLLQLTSGFMQDKMSLTDIEETLSRDLHMLRQELSCARASLQELASSKSNTQQELGSLKQRLFFIDKRVPELEGEKKVAASARNFKEAARISTEMKSLGLEKEGLNARMENALSVLKKLDEQISDTINRIQETELLISSKEKESAVTTFQRLMLNADVANAERSAALELGDHEEADVLFAEAEASAAEARKLQTSYDVGNEDVDNLNKHFVPLELISNLGNKQLAELSGSLHILS